MTESVEFLRDYRSKMDTACEALAMKLDDIGYRGAAEDDDEIVNIATRKLGTMFELIKASGLSDGILKAIMAE